VTKNVGDADRTLRLAIGATLGVVFFSHRVTGAAEVLLGLITVWLLATSLTGWCPFYALLRISTRSPHDVAPADH
jgi:hypothetical protein